MPDVYKSLAVSLNSPQFIYVSASPFQLYPFLRDFIDTTYGPEAAGPIMLKNLTTTNLSDLIDFTKVRH
jgi:phosphatidate phosphatase APP1